MRSVCAIVVVVVVVVLITVIMPAKFELLAFVLLCFHTFFLSLSSCFLLLLFVYFYGWANMLKMKFAYLKVLNKPAHAHKQTHILAALARL